MLSKEERNNSCIKKRFGFFYDLNKYSLKEMIANYCVMFGWIIGIIIQVINCVVNKTYIDAVIHGKITIKPWIFDRLSRFAFVFIALTLIGLIFKIIWMTKRKKGKLLSYYNSLNKNNVTFDENQKPHTSWILKGIYIALGVVITTIVMLAVWVF